MTTYNGHSEYEYIAVCVGECRFGVKLVEGSVETSITIVVKIMFVLLKAPSIPLHWYYKQGHTYLGQTNHACDLGL